MESKELCGQLEEVNIDPQSGYVTEVEDAVNTAGKRLKIAAVSLGFNVKAPFTYGMTSGGLTLFFRVSPRRVVCATCRLDGLVLIEFEDTVDVFTPSQAATFINGLFAKHL